MKKIILWVISSAACMSATTLTTFDNQYNTHDGIVRLFRFLGTPIDTSISFPENVSSAKIAYRALAPHCHPDKVAAMNVSERPAYEEFMRNIGVANSTLTDFLDLYQRRKNVSVQIFESSGILGRLTLPPFHAQLVSEFVQPALVKVLAQKAAEATQRQQAEFAVAYASARQHFIDEQFSGMTAAAYAEKSELPEGMQTVLVQMGYTLFDKLQKGTFDDSRSFLGAFKTLSGVPANCTFDEYLYAPYAAMVEPTLLFRRVVSCLPGVVTPACIAPASAQQIGAQQSYFIAVIALSWAIMDMAYKQEHAYLGRGSITLIDPNHMIYNFLKRYHDFANGIAANLAFPHSDATHHTGFTPAGQFGIDARLSNQGLLKLFPNGYTHLRFGQLAINEATPLTFFKIERINGTNTAAAVARYVHTEAVFNDPFARCDLNVSSFVSTAYKMLKPSGTATRIHLMYREFLESVRAGGAAAAAPAGTASAAASGTEGALTAESQAFRGVVEVISKLSHIEIRSGNEIILEPKIANQPLLTIVDRKQEVQEGKEQNRNK